MARLSTFPPFCGSARRSLRLWTTLFLITFVLLPTYAGAVGLVEGLRKYEAGDYAGAVDEWQPLADQGNPDALFNLGQVYRLGRGFAVDSALAVEYYRRAAAAGHAGARGALATIYYFDHGTRQKRGEAIGLWRQAAAAGDAPSQYTLAILHFNGQDVPQDLMQAYAWALLAAEGGLEEGAKAEQSIRPHLTPNQLRQAQVLKGGLLVSTPAPAFTPAPAPAPIVAPLTADDDDAVAEIQVKAAAEPAPEPDATKAVAEKDTAAQSAAANEAADSEQALPVEELAAGTWSVQLGFYRERRNVEQYWDQVAARAEKLVADVSSRIVTIDTGPERGIFYQLLVGNFDDRAGADYLCDNLKASDIDCVVQQPLSE